MIAVAETLLRNRRRYGGYVVHLGVLLMVVGFTGSAFKAETDAVLNRGGSMDVGSYRLTYDSFRQDETAEKTIFEAEIKVTRGTDYVTTMRPQRNFHKAQGQPQSEVSIRTTPIEDLYVVVTSVDPDGGIALRAFVNPLTWWIWAGAAVMTLGIWVVLMGDMPVPAVAKETEVARAPAVVGAP